MTVWTPDQWQRRTQAEAGRTVVATLRQRNGTAMDGALVAWGHERGLLARIDRGTPWGNPFVMRREDDRDAVCDHYAAALARRPDLLARLPELRGRILLCWCYPLRCHGDHLAELANAVR